jgi:protocatechuate 3,4-dioxygenase, alpha subunit
MRLVATTSQTVGPFFQIGLSKMYVNDLTCSGARGERIAIRGRILDGDGQPVPDAVVEIWQANSEGKYAHPDDPQAKHIDPLFQGYGRTPTDDQGLFQFRTIKPGPVPAPDGKMQARHIAVSIFMRGLLKRLVTRIYFPDEPANSADYILNLVEPSRRFTLIANASPNQPGILEWNVFLQGPRETVFFEL